MASSLQPVTLTASPSYPNAIAWSDENLIAVASGHTVTIMNPALPHGPRGIITISAGEPLPIGVVDRKELLSGWLLTTCLSRDLRPCVRSISWSPLGMASNSGCLLAVCSVDGRVNIYRPPYDDFGAEWIEVLDVTRGLYEYLVRIRFGDSEAAPQDNSDMQAGEVRCAHNSPDALPRKECKRRKINKGFETIGNHLLPPPSSKDADSSSCFNNHEDGQITNMVSTINSDSLMNTKHQIICMFNSKVNSMNKTMENSNLPVINAAQCASRIAMLHSLVVAWSPMLQTPSTLPTVQSDGTSTCLLAVGGKYGKVALWKFHAPDCYTIEHGRVLTSGKLVGLLQAHNLWITSICWAFFASDSSSPQLSLVTGSSDGSVRIWLADRDKLLQSSIVDHNLFFLLKEVITVDNVPVSALSVIVPSFTPYKMLLAVAKTSGAFEVWNCDVSSEEFKKSGSYNPQQCVVTGLVWAFDGSHLYSCSQDNFVRCWIWDENCLCEVPIPYDTPHNRKSCCSIQHPRDVFNSCFGVAISPGSLIVATVHSFDLDKLDHMYEARTHKAAVEYLWIGGQKVNVLSKFLVTFDAEEFLGFPEKKLAHWESNIIWSLKQYEDIHKPIVVWEIVNALSAFKQNSSKYLENVLSKWLSTFLGFEMCPPAEEVLLHISQNLSKFPSRWLHLLNIMCRCIMLSDLGADQLNHISKRMENLGQLCPNNEKELAKWIEILLRSERELRERLVGLNFSAFITLMPSDSDITPCQPGYLFPVGLAQMKNWVACENDLQDQVKVLAAEIGMHEKSKSLSGEYLVAEQCSYCSSSVPFESPEVGFCRGEGCKNHRLPRCSASMQVCPAKPLWFCTCCCRSSLILAPQILFTMSAYPEDFKSLFGSSSLSTNPKPLCPFCGILLQRRQPDFLLSPSPV